MRFFSILILFLFFSVANASTGLDYEGIHIGDCSLITTSESLEFKLVFFLYHKGNYINAFTNEDSYGIDKYVVSQKEGKKFLRKVHILEGGNFYLFDEITMDKNMSFLFHAQTEVKFDPTELTITKFKSLKFDDDGMQLAEVSCTKFTRP